MSIVIFTGKKHIGMSAQLTGSSKGYIGSAQEVSKVIIHQNKERVKDLFIYLSLHIRKAIGTMLQIWKA